jgi:hypothetical protein
MFTLQTLKSFNSLLLSQEFSSDSSQRHSRSSQFVLSSSFHLQPTHTCRLHPNNMIHRGPNTSSTFLFHISAEDVPLLPTSFPIPWPYPIFVVGIPLLNLPRSLPSLAGFGGEEGHDYLSVRGCFLSLSFHPAFWKVCKFSCWIESS